MGERCHQLCRGAKGHVRPCEGVREEEATRVHLEMAAASDLHDVEVSRVREI
jgi:hypothetical protein